MPAPHGQVSGQTGKGEDSGEGAAVRGSSVRHLEAEDQLGHMPEVSCSCALQIEPCFLWVMPSILACPLPSLYRGSPQWMYPRMARLSSGLPQGCRSLSPPEPPTGVPMRKPQSSLNSQTQTHSQILWSPKQIMCRACPLFWPLKTRPGSVSASGAFSMGASTTRLVHQQPLLVTLWHPVEQQALNPLMQWVPCSVFLSFSHLSLTFGTLECERSRINNTSFHLQGNVG